MNNNVLGLFPTPVYKTTLKKDYTNLTNLLEQETFQSDDQSWPERYGYRSLDTYVLNNKIYQKLAIDILENVNQFVKNVLCYNIDNIGITQSWINKKEQNNMHEMHTHPNSIVSGVFYWQDEIEPIVFHKTKMPEKVDFHYNENQLQEPYAQNSAVINLGKNDLVIFPSSLAHNVYPNRSRNARFSLSFNTWATGPIGNKDFLTELDFNRITKM